MRGHRSVLTRSLLEALHEGAIAGIFPAEKLFSKCYPSRHIKSVSCKLTYKIVGHIPAWSTWCREVEGTDCTGFVVASSGLDGHETVDK